MLSSTPKIQSQLSEALALIGKHNFPKLWPTLLPELIIELQKASQASDYASINGILGTANSIFMKFRCILFFLLIAYITYINLSLWLVFIWFFFFYSVMLPSL